MPLVTVVILTMNRPTLLLQSVQDVLRQTFQDLELIVVIDGPDDATVQALHSIQDPRLRYVQHERNLGISAGRNTGFREAKGDYIALQDDDDRWYPDKIAKQVAAAEQAGGKYVFSFCRYLENTKEFKNLRPERMPSPDEVGQRFTDYMYCDRGLIVPCIVMVSRALAMEYPFDLSLQPAEDSDFFIRCMSDSRVRLAVVSEVLAEHMNLPPASGQYRMSQTGRWRGVFAWAVRQRALFSKRAFAFLLTRTVTQMATDQEATLREKLSIFATALLLGTFSPRTWIYFLASAFLTRQRKHSIRRFLSKEARTYSQRTGSRTVASGG